MSSTSIAAPLRDLDCWVIELHGDHMQPGSDDAAVARFCGERGWALVTCDDMRYTPETKRALHAHRVRVVRVTGRRDSHYLDVVAALVDGRQQIIALLKKNTVGLCAHVRKGGAVQIMTRFEDIEPTLSESQRKTFRRYGRVR